MQELKLNIQEPLSPLIVSIPLHINEHTDVKCAMALFFGEKNSAVGDDQPQVACAGLIHARIINFIQNAMTQREPYLAVAG